LTYVNEAELFHFVGRGLPEDQQYRLLCDIVKGGIISHPPHKNDGGRFGYTSQFIGGKWQGDLISEKFRDDGKLMFPNITCFADIPFDDLHIHVSKYSEYGLSFSKPFIAKYGGRPVMYFPYWNDDPQNVLFGDRALNRINDTIRDMEESKPNSNSSNDTQNNNAGPVPEDVMRCLYMEFLAYIKPFDVNLPLDEPRQYYMEREWRKIGNVKFKKSDIIGILLPKKFKQGFINQFPELATKVRSLPSRN